MNRFSSIKTTRSRLNWFNNAPTTIVVVVFLPLFLLSWLKPAFISNTLSYLFAPLLKTETRLHNAILGVDNTNSTTDASELDRLRSENEELRSLLGAAEEPRIAAGVIGRPTNLPYDVMVLDKGASDGIIKDAPVYIGSDKVIGFVVEVYRYSSVVALVTTPGWRSTVYIYGPNIYTTAVGQGGGIARVHVPQGVALEVGNTVVVPSLSGGTYGNVTVVDSSPTKPEQYGYVALDTPIHSLRLVSVGTRPLSVIDFATAKEVIDSTRRELLEVPVPEGVLIEIDSADIDDTATSTAPVDLTDNDTND